MAVYAPSLSIFLLSQFPTAPYLPALTPRPPPKSWFYLLHDQRAVGPIHGIMIFTFASVVLSLIAFSFSIVRPFIMERKKDPEATLRRAREKSYERNTAIMNNNAVLKKLEPQIERNYQRKLDLWDR
jgi:hypothetical protein